MTVFKPGSELSQYTIIGKLARGGMSEIYLARVNGPLGFSKFVVLKVILPHLLDKPKYAKMFQYEARLAAMLNHPNVVQIFGFDRSDEAHFIAMEYIDGQNLREILKALVERGQRLPRSIALHLVCCACGVLEYAHDFTDPSGRPMKIIHRDVSLENILITYTGQVKLVDFGIAKATIVDVSTTDGKVKGKLHYMAPEMIQDDRPDHRVDIYALGVVLYSSLLMRKPFSGCSHAELFDKVQDEDPPMPREVDPNLPAELEQIILKAIRKDPDQRYQSAAEMRQDLEAYIRQSGLLVLPSHLTDFMRSVFPPGTDPVRECYLDLTRLTTTGLVAEDEARFGLSEPYAGLQSPAEGGLKRRRWTQTNGAGRARRSVSARITDPIVETFEFLRPFRRRVLAFVFLALLGLASGALATQSLFASQEIRLPDHEAARVVARTNVARHPEQRKPAAPVERQTRGIDHRRAPDKRAPRPRHRRGVISVRAPLPAVAFLDGTRLGRLPLRRRLEPGTYQLTVRSDRLHYSMTRLIRVRSGAPKRIRLSPRKGTLRVYVQPWGKVSLDGRVVGTTPIPLLSAFEGPHQIVVENRALRVRRRIRVWVSPGKRRIVRVFLKRRSQPLPLPSP